MITNLFPRGTHGSLTVTRHSLDYNGGSASWCDISRPATSNSQSTASTCDGAPTACAGAQTVCAGAQTVFAESFGPGAETREAAPDLKPSQRICGRGNWLTSTIDVKWGFRNFDRRYEMKVTADEPRTLLMLEAVLFPRFAERRLEQEGLLPWKAARELVVLLQGQFLLSFDGLCHSACRLSKAALDQAAMQWLASLRGPLPCNCACAAEAFRVGSLAPLRCHCHNVDDVFAPPTSPAPLRDIEDPDVWTTLLEPAHPPMLTQVEEHVAGRRPRAVAAAAFLLATSANCVIVRVAKVQWSPTTPEGLSTGQALLFAALCQVAG
jgi:hypothetical protein